MPAGPHRLCACMSAALRSCATWNPSDPARVQLQALSADPGSLGGRLRAQRPQGSITLASGTDAATWCGRGRVVQTRHTYADRDAGGTRKGAAGEGRGCAGAWRQARGAREGAGGAAAADCTRSRGECRATARAQRGQAGQGAAPTPGCRTKAHLESAGLPDNVRQRCRRLSRRRLASWQRT
jgi:hypothetical protein